MAIAISTRAQTFTVLHHFNYTDGSDPQGDLILSGNTLYGVAPFGGNNGKGTVFKVNTDGTGFTVLHHFAAGGYNSSWVFINGDGSSPSDGLVLSGNTLYGTTSSGGPNGAGSLFSINIDGSSFTNLYFFTATTTSYPRTNNDGANPHGRLLLMDERLYGVTANGGPHANGVVFSISTNGTSFTNLHQFTGGIDGGAPSAGLILSSNILYGAAANGGTWGREPFMPSIQLVLTLPTYTVFQISHTITSNTPTVMAPIPNAS